MQWLAAGLGIGYVAVVLFAFVFQRQLVYVPAPERPTPAAAGLAEMAPLAAATTDGLTVTGWYRPPTDPAAPVVALFPGNAGHIGNRRDKARRLLAHGFGLLLAEYRGYGGNPGAPSEAGLYADGRAYLAALAARGIAAGRVVLYGESLGCAVAVRLALDHPVQAVVLEAPFTSLPDAGAVHYPLLPVHWLARERYDSLARIAGIDAPVLILHGTADAVVPVAHGRRLLAAAAEPKQGVFPDGVGHQDVLGPALAETIGFLAHHTGWPRAPGTVLAR